VRRIAPRPRASVVERRLATLKVDIWTTLSRQRRRLICKSELGREANRQRCRRGAAEEPSTDIGPGKEVQMVPDGHAALQGLSSIPHLTSVATGFYRNDVINGSGTSVGQACLMMSKFAVAQARLIDNSGRKSHRNSPTAAALHGDVLGMNRAGIHLHRQGAIAGDAGEHPLSPATNAIPTQELLTKYLADMSGEVSTRALGVHRRATDREMIKSSLRRDFAPAY
ncbi:hypothetical protein THAOC_02774, partial [Thalassiosira oceanica]